MYPFYSFFYWYCKNIQTCSNSKSRWIDIPWTTSSGSWIFISKSINFTTKSTIFPLFATSSVLLDMYVVLNEVMDIFPRLLQHVYSTSAWIRAGNEVGIYVLIPSWYSYGYYPQKRWPAQKLRQIELNKKEFSKMMIANWQATRRVAIRALLCNAGNIYLLVLSCLKVNIAENPIAVMGL